MNDLYAVAREYLEKAELYDRKVCSGPITADGIMPATDRERILINRHSIYLIKQLASEHGVSTHELRKAINGVDR